MRRTQHRGASPARTPVAAALALLLGTALVPAVTLAASTAPAATQQADAAPALMLAGAWEARRSPAGFLVSEKYDGVRAFWDGRVLRFRSGRPIAAPAWFTAALPPVPLDGELWLGRGRFAQLSGIVRHEQPVDADWRAVRYLVFDLPGAGGSFAERARRIAGLVQRTAQPWLQAVAQQPLDSADALQAHLKQVVQGGGEGLVLHRAEAPWVPGRSSDLFKFKLQPDADARVVAHLPGKGRNAGHLGALLLELPNGKRFALGSGLSDAERADPPALGSLVTYRYRGRTANGLPRFASFLRVRSPDE